jgi:hypothetical protein
MSITFFFGYLFIEKCYAAINFNVQHHIRELRISASGQGQEVFLSVVVNDKCDLSL